jgi:hypothetical protein
MVKFEFQNQRFNNAMTWLAGLMKDLRPVFISIKDDWYKNNRELFDLKSPGRYTPYKGSASGETPYMKWKRAHAIQRSPYPMLKAANGRMESGLTNPHSPFTVNEMEKQSLTLGLQGEDYFVYMQKGTANMAKRPGVFNETAGGDDYKIQMQRFISIAEGALARRLSFGRPVF